MATELYDVEYHDGKQRVKQLTREEADRLKERDQGVRSVTKSRGVAQTKLRQSQRDKGRNPHADEAKTRRIQEDKTERANENEEQ